MDSDSVRLDVAFNTLPIEACHTTLSYLRPARTNNLQQLNQGIARYLESDKDFVAFRATCRGARNAIDADNGSFWRAVFREKFALRQGRTNKDLRRTYQRRMKLLRRGTGYDFYWGHSKREQDVVEVLQDIIVGMYSIIREPNIHKC